MNEAPDSKKPTNDDVDEIVESMTEDDTEPVDVEAEESEAEESELADKVPLHLVHPPPKPEDKRPGVRRKRGRPKKVEPKPTTDEWEYHRQMQAAQAAFVESDPIVQATQARKDSAEMLQALKERLARMTAVLEFMRIEGQKRGKLDGQLVSRQVAATREIAQIELKIRELGAQTIDLRSEPMQKVFAMFIDKIQEVAREVLTPKQFDVLWNRLETSLDGWEEEAESVIR